MEKMVEGKIAFDLEVKANELREDTLKMCIKAGTGHVTSCMSCAEVMSVLYFGDVMKQDPENPEWKDRDRFILSKGQASPILYVSLAKRGFFPTNHVDQFAKGVDGKGKDAPFGVHLQCTVPGVEFTTGSLGHGLGYGVGLAEAAKIKDQDHSVYVLLGDGELYEGSNWESMLYANHHKLNNLVAVVDRNEQCTNGYTERDIVKLDPIGEKFSAFGWDVKTVNGHSTYELLDALGDENSSRESPLVVIAETVKGAGIKSFVGRKYFHGMAPKGDDAVNALKELGDFADEHKSKGGYDGFDWYGRQS
jgi:transketolase